MPARKRCSRIKVKRVNPFVNFLNSYRLQHKNWPACKIAVDGALHWSKMSEFQRARYYKGTARNNDISCFNKVTTFRQQRRNERSKANRRTRSARVRHTTSVAKKKRPSHAKRNKSKRKPLNFQSYVKHKYAISKRSKFGGKKSRCKL